ncbi:nuclear transport factor 2 family protein [Halopiger aswanensis]|uniref:Ketosteroid isomerase-like protein n=1 Tax=Halopiger aswanensis TaxID=148449 RepID=A0A3R7I0D6_9EURY|nr:nuclear transport factor 2 family protein [Halopiger aswanensis]RKD98407.1 ketosteroid isomerase-like protein [Halopiger aswanensis]
MDSDSDADGDSATKANTDAGALVRRYYDGLDDHDYDALAEILAPDFVQRRPDRTFDDRASFVQFMREKRPNPNTTHEVIDIVADDRTVAARGRVLEAATDASDNDDDDRVLFEFADFFAVSDGRIERLETYAR